MAKTPMRDRLLPHRILNYLLYAPAVPAPGGVEWLETVSDDEIKIYTGPGSRAMRMRIAAFREALFWLLDQQLVLDVRQERKRGTLIVRLRQPTNIKAD